MNKQEEGLQDEIPEPNVSENKTQKSELETPETDASIPHQATEQDDESHKTDATDANDSEPDESEHSLDGLQYKIAVLSEALESAKDKSIRAQAEVENIRRRAANEQINSRKFAIESFASELLLV